ncbi:MAG: polyprenyl synthetase family protein [Methylophilaceae bacterium]
MKIIISSHFDEFYMPLEAKIDLPKVEVELKQSFLTNNKLLNKWLSHQKKSKGKFIRAQLALAAGELLDLPKNTVIKWATACELMHTASLVHDDICDQDVKRRGDKTIWKKYGIPAAICTGDFLIAQAFNKISEIETGWHQTILLKSLSDSVKKIIDGQIRDVEVNIKKISLKEYEKIAYEKTGPLLMTPLDGMFRCKELTEAEITGLVNLMHIIGLVYQMINDLNNAMSDKTDITLKHMNFINIINNDKGKSRKSNFNDSIEQGKEMIIKKLSKIDRYIHQVPIILQPIFISISAQLKESL